MNLSPEKLAPPVAFVLVGSIMLVVGITGVIPFGNPQPSIAEPLLKAVLILLGILLILSGPVLVWREQISTTNPDEAILRRTPRTFRAGKQDENSTNIILANRKNMLSLELLIQKAQKEVIMCAVQQSYLAHHGLSLLQAKLESGCKVKILMMAARDQNGEINRNVIESESHRTYKGLLAQIESSAQLFENWFDSLSEASKKLIEIRAYQQCPIAALILIDKDEPSGLIQSEILLYGIDVREMPHYVLTKKAGSNLFKTHCDSFEQLWRSAQVVRSWQR